MQSAKITGGKSTAPGNSDIEDAVAGRKVARKNRRRRIAHVDDLQSGSLVHDVSEVAGNRQDVGIAGRVDAAEPRGRRRIADVDHLQAGSSFREIQVTSRDGDSRTIAARVAARTNGIERIAHVHEPQSPITNGKAGEFAR